MQNFRELNSKDARSVNVFSFSSDYPFVGKIIKLKSILFYIFQAVERNVANTTLAAKSVVGPEKRHGFLLSLNQKRKEYNGPPTVDVFEKQRQLF